SVASRSYVLAQLAAQGKQLFDTDSSQYNQVFKYISEYSAEIARVREAVKKTAGTVLHDKDGSPLWAYYHADCGGHTDEPDNVWNNHQFYGTTKDLNCPARPNTNWEADLSLPLLNKKLLPLFETKSKIVSVSVGEKSKSGRVKNMIVKMADGSVEKIRSNQFRQQLGFSWIRSTLFGMTQIGSKYHLSGKGFGHGVGLCQWGSRELAKAGTGYLAILKTYYPAAKIEKGKQLP
ncbi:MAG: SpoIID/LytB domain-containing protein, partial [Bdellovibrionia bacterium]